MEWSPVGIRFHVKHYSQYLSQNQCVIFVLWKSTKQHPADNFNKVLTRTLVHVAGSGHGLFTVIVRKGRLLQISKLCKCLVSLERSPSVCSHLFLRADPAFWWLTPTKKGKAIFSASHFRSSECNYKMTVNRNNEGQDEVWKITLDRFACRIRRKASQKLPLDGKRPAVEHWSATAAQIWKVISEKTSPSSLSQNSA